MAFRAIRAEHLAGEWRLAAAISLDVDELAPLPAGVKARERYTLLVQRGGKVLCGVDAEGRVWVSPGVEVRRRWEPATPHSA